MIKKTAAVATLLLFSGLATAGDLTVDSAIGGAIGGAVGGALGAEVGGRDGAIVGAGIGAAAGAAINTDEYRGDRYYQPEPRYIYRDAPYYPSRGFCPPGQAKKGRC